MPFKDSARRKSYQKKYHEGWYATNGDHRRQQVRDRRRRIKQQFRAYKETLMCHLCGLSGEDNAWALDFHHISDDEKLSSISHLVTSGYGWSTIMNEIEKCIVICANCHRKEHWEQYKADLIAGNPTTHQAKGAKIGQRKRKKRRRLERKMLKERQAKNALNNPDSDINRII